MPKSAIERGTEALAELFPDPTVREARRMELGDAGLTTLGNAVLRQDDYSRSMNELGEARRSVDGYKGTLDTWWEDKQADLAELERLRAELAGRTPPTPTPTPTPDPAAPKYLTEEQFNARMAEAERGVVAYTRDMQTLTLQHFQQFGEVLDTNAILQDRRVQQIGVSGVYRELHKERLEAKANEARAAAEQKIRDDERRKVQAEMASNAHPYPVSGHEPSALDGIKPNLAPQAATVEDMVGEYQRLTAARG